MIVFFFNDTATTEIYTLSLHDALPISGVLRRAAEGLRALQGGLRPRRHASRSCPIEVRRGRAPARPLRGQARADRKSTRLNSSHANISYAVFCLKKKKTHHTDYITSSN